MPLHPLSFHNTKNLVPIVYFDKLAHFMRFTQDTNVFEVITEFTRRGNFAESNSRFS